jgi:hypothetical protein
MTSANRMNATRLFCDWRIVAGVHLFLMKLADAQRVLNHLYHVGQAVSVLEVRVQADRPFQTAFNPSVFSGRMATCFPK